MGDASFVARPHIGMGVAKAAEDALALTDAIRMCGANPSGLAVYAKARLPEGRSAVQRARWLGSYVCSLDAQIQPMTERQYQAIHETAIDLGRYGHQSRFKENLT
jgi:2-polyprenyl-6-methoxyphenol hydroxylase-like FAD-dependent oxidoreductase